MMLVTITIFPRLKITLIPIYRDTAKQFYNVQVQNRQSTSFWFDNRCRLGCLQDITGKRGYIDLGIPSHATVAFAKVNHRRRNHRIDGNVQIEEKIDKLVLREEEDFSSWRNYNDKYKGNFYTKVTKSLVCISHPWKEWYKGVWFPNSTPKYSFFTWLAINNQLSARDQIQHWNSGRLHILWRCKRIPKSSILLMLIFSTSLDHTRKSTKQLLPRMGPTGRLPTQPCMQSDTFIHL